MSSNKTNLNKDIDDVQKGSAGPGHGRGGAANGRIRLEKDSIPTIKRVLSYIKAGGHLGQLIGSLSLLVVSSLVGVASSLFLKTLIDKYIEPLLLEAVPDFSGLIKALLVMAGIYLIGMISDFVSQILLTIMAHGVLKNIRDDMFAHMQTLPVRYFDSHSYGEIMSRYTNDTDTMRQMLSQSLPQVISSLVMIVATMTSMIVLSPALTLIEVAAIIISYLITISIGGKSAKFFVVRQRKVGEMNGYIEEMLTGQKVVKIFCHEEEAKREFDKKNEELCAATTKANALANIIMPMMGNLGNFKYAVIAMVGGLMAIRGVGALTLGTIASFLLLSKSFNRPITQISQQVNSVVMALAGAKRVFDLMDAESETDNGTVTLIKTGDEQWAWHTSYGDVLLCGDVKLENVDFGYREDHQILYDVSLYAKPGQKIAFVGSTGAGKTTITNLINRFYDIEDGNITFDGIDINEIKKSDLRRSLGMVLQDTNLFTGSIKENIRYGRLDATDEEIIAAAKLANADGFITRLPNGYDEVIDGSVSRLSQGQAQLISIARCAIANPPVMILDEATSSIDTRTEALVQSGMDKLMDGRTVFVIAHRLSTVQNSNAIMVLEKGHIIERGDHDDLIAQQGRYYQLYTGKEARLLP